MDFLEGLNPQQRAAVENVEGPTMIVAGAGSGKTRVITYRVAHLIRKGVDPFRILVLTFTNKASKEMRERIVQVVGGNAKSIAMGTFHSVFARILRVESEKIGYPKSFTIYDTDDCKSLIRSIVKELNLDDKIYTANTVLHRISDAKNNLINAAAYKNDPNILKEDLDFKRPEINKIYTIYTEKMFQQGAMDFDDLLFNTNVLLHLHPDVLYKYQHKFQYIMVDEYQDTNYSQYFIVKKLAAAFRNICVVGDDAQSIYAFRGANIKNILNFQKDYPELRTFNLEQNYRSTQNIVNAANSIIAKNEERLDKNVFSKNEVGSLIKIERAFSDNEEGRLVADSILQMRSSEGLDFAHFAILYRTNSQSRPMEEALRKLNIPYKIFGGLSFYQRKEIKDLIAYFRVIINPKDEEALKRIINYPKRGIGDTTIDKIIIAADKHGKTLWEIVENVQFYLDGRSAASVYVFSTMMQSFKAEAKKLNAFDLANLVAKESGILKELYADNSIESRSKYEHVQELLNGIKEFSENDELEDRSLEVFLQDIALLTNDDRNVEGEENTDVVSLMTIHSSKGLEFRNVYVVGLEENLFPSQLSVNSRKDLEEERRLFYVAVTRAEKSLHISYATSRYKFGTLTNCEPSRFINEIDPQYLDISAARIPSLLEPINFNQEKRTWSQTAPEPSFQKPMPLKQKTTSKLAKAHKVSENFNPNTEMSITLGDRVEHQLFGFGVVVGAEGAKIKVIFDEIGEKDIMLGYGKISKI